MHTHHYAVTNLLIAALLQLTGCSTLDEQAPSQSSGAPQAVSDGCEVTYRDTSTFGEYLVAGWQGTNNLQKLIIASDPQPFRVINLLGQEVIDEGIWKNTATVTMQQLAGERTGDRYVPLIINGDMTEFGHGGERKALREQIVKSMGSASSTPRGPLMLPGLGNHDYANNVGDCANNGCARDAVCDHIIWTKTIQAMATGFSFDHTFSGQTHTGSLAYSFDMGNLHVVQLNNEPTYTVYFETGGSTAPGEKRKFNITSAMTWLEQDLASAKSRGKYTIINMHKPNGWQNESIRKGKFTELLAKNRVVAVFAGHYHKTLGYSSANSFGRVPLFQSGGILNKNYLRLLFDWSSKILQVNWYHTITEKGEYKYNLDTLDPIKPPPGKQKVTIIYFKGKNFTGGSCTVDLIPGDIKKINNLCPGFGSVAGTSFKAINFGDGVNKTQFCLAIPFFGGQRCYIGNFTGNFEVPDLTPPAKLPTGLIENRLMEDKGYENFNYQTF